MRRTWWTRLTAAVLGIWLVLVIGEPGIVHACPTHGGGALHAGAAGGRAGTMGMAHHVAGGSHAPAHEHHGCTCIGCCVGVSAAALIASAPTTAIAVALVPVVVARTSVAVLPRPGPRHGRPYPTGPPRA